MNFMTHTDWLIVALGAMATFFAWATFRMVRANQALVSSMHQQQYAAMRPYILVSAIVRPGTQMLYLSIKNVGKTAALDLELSLDRDVYQLGKKGAEYNVTSNAVFSRIIDCLPPEGQLLLPLGSSNGLHNSTDNDAYWPLLFEVKADYSSNLGPHCEITTVDLWPFIHTTAQPDPISDELQKLRQVVLKISKLMEKKN
jgi:hypothetical protein